MKKSTRSLILAASLAVASILQGIGIARYASRLPDDWVGIGLYAATCVAFAIGAIAFLIQWRKEKHKEGLDIEAN